jgi:hypothetical protein
VSSAAGQLQPTPLALPRSCSRRRTSSSRTIEPGVLFSTLYKTAQYKTAQSPGPRPNRINGPSATLSQASRWLREYASVLPPVMRGWSYVRLSRGMSAACTGLCRAGRTHHYPNISSNAPFPQSQDATSFWLSLGAGGGGPRDSARPADWNINWSSPFLEESAATTPPQSITAG